MRKRYKKKARSCPMCKPHKMQLEDRRTRQTKKADEKLKLNEGIII